MCSTPTCLDHSDRPNSLPHRKQRTPRSSLKMTSPMMLRSCYDGDGQAPVARGTRSFWSFGLDGVLTMPLGYPLETSPDAKKAPENDQAGQAKGRH